MLKYALMAVAAATLVAVVFIMLPTGGGPRPEPRLLANTDPQSSTSFTIHDAPPPAPVTPNAPASASSTVPSPSTPSVSDLDAVMQRLRANAGNPAAPGTPAPDATITGQVVAPAPPAPTAAVPATPAAAAPPAAVPTPDPNAAVPPANPASPPNRWASVTAQGTRWRMARASNGYLVSIDLGGGQVADIHVLPAFANLDPAAINVRVDYLRDTILQNFSNQSGSYSFARDGSVSVDR